VPNERLERDYRQRVTSAAEAVQLIAPGAIVFHTMAAGEPPGLLGALADRLRRDDRTEVTVHSMLPLDVASQTILAPDLEDRVHSRSWFLSGGDREAVREGHADFVPNHFHQIPRIIEQMEVDVSLVAVSPMDDSGHFSLGVTNDYNLVAARRAKTVILEVNPRMPRVFGDSLIHVSDVAAIVEHESELQELPKPPDKPESETIARAIAERIPNGATLQIGIGGVPNAVCGFLESHRDLGIHTELLTGGMVDLVQAGVINGSRKTLHRGKHVFTTALGQRAMYDAINDDPTMESYPVSHTNDPAIIAQNDDMISVNATLEIDLLGQCNSEYLDGHQFSGTGGQLDYVRGAYAAKRGQSVIALYSTTHDGAVSRIVPRLDPGAVITTPRMDIHLAATEFGLVELKGKSVRERAHAIISLAHPRFRDELTQSAREMDLI
jgi:itaconate CoA-transferase